ncbi:antibiotic biosynthesis monooxygenase [Phytoactinopolyspora halotolerans]|uniref:ABM domain-containing protein n=1 Tax=Phytoactinopolyspora halotolerans TaxID=1981512 RepID=A0A6L9SGE1_9ACTN|nr:antibiotic biosynthesis monooxygenase [Phytoactinopolyspora halotolerans]NEE04213.1 hypothetical protein [Phytoactinopolyspora halotolerans]
MTVVRMHQYKVDPERFQEFLDRRTAAIDAIREAHPGLIETRLTRLEDGTYTDVWRWDSIQHMGAAAAQLAAFPEAPAAMSMTSDATAVNGEIIDER